MSSTPRMKRRPCCTSLTLSGLLVAAASWAADLDAPLFRAPYMLSLPPTGAAVLCDFDRDGTPDMLTADGALGGSAIHFRRGRGNGTFEPVAATPITVPPSRIATGDMTGDGIDDLVMVTAEPFLGETDPPQVVVFEGQAGGTFIQRAAFDIDPWAERIAIGQIDGDGFAEALLATPSGVHMLRTTDGQTFGLVSLAAPPFEVKRVRLASLSAAGPALLAWSNEGGALVIYESDGAGGLLPPLTVDPRIDISDVVAADIVGDTTAELLITGSSDYEVMERNASGQWVTRSFGATMFWASDASIACGDMDGDGPPDLVVTSLLTHDDGYPLLHFLEGHGDGTFGPRVVLASGAEPRSLLHLVEATDLDADGDPDLWTYDGRPFVHLNTGPSAFIPVSPVYDRPLYHPIQTMDFDMDRRPDIAVGYDRIFIGTSQPGGGFVWDSLAVTGDLLGFAAVFADPDTIPDVVAHSSTGITVFTGDGSGFSAAFHATPLSWGTAAVADVNGDGWADFLDVVQVPTGNPWQPWHNQLRLALADGLGGFGPHEPLHTMSLISDLDVDDFDEDGLADILISGGQFNTVLTGLPGGGFTPVGTSAPVGSASNSVVADFDGDGHLDVACDAQGRLTVCLGNGALGFTSTLYEWSSYAPIIRSADIDGDGKPDLIYSVEGGTLRVRRNLGDGTFGAMLGYGEGDAWGGVTVLDYDGDGVLDLVSAGGRGVYVSPGIPSEPTLSVPAASVRAKPALRIHPQPARDSATLRFALREAGVVTVDLYDLSGRRVQAASPAWMPAGEHTLSLSVNSGKPLLPGIYLVRVADSLDQRTGKLIVVR